MIHLVQISNGVERRVAVVEEPQLRCLEDVSSVYELALRYAKFGSKLSEQASALASGELLDYDAIYAGRSEWHLLTPIDVPGSAFARTGERDGVDAPGERARTAGDAFGRAGEGG